MNPLHSSPYNWGQQNVRQVMLTVQLAATPALFVHAYFFGIGIFIQMLIGLTVALSAEAAMLYLRNKPIKPYLTDWSIILTTLDIVFCLPPTSPWWIVVSAVLFAVILAKHVFGGLGYNIFNPAMAGYAFVLISFPAVMTVWHLPNALIANPLDAWQAVQLIFTSTLPDNIHIDALTGATPLEAARTGLLNDQTLSSIFNHEVIFQGEQLASSSFWMNISFLLGGLFLLYRGIIRWQMPVGFLLAITLLATTFHTIDPERYASLSFHLFSGATMLAAFFIITDPVTGSTTPSGRLYFGIGAGVLVYVIRTWGGYADAVAFAVLLMNMLAPWIDSMTVPRVYGHGQPKVTHHE
jgi:electron transport complex protein RnfD